MTEYFLYIKKLVAISGLELYLFFCLLKNEIRFLKRFNVIEKRLEEMSWEEAQPIYQAFHEGKDIEYLHISMLDGNKAHWRLNLSSVLRKFVHYRLIGGEG